MYQHPLLMAPRRDSDSECENNYQSPLQCCVPKGECHMANVLDFGILSLDDLRNAVRVICTNENCTSGQYMHVECFAQWENGVLNNFKNYSWSENLKHDNMWTKKCFDLIYKACTCRCGRGFLRKDLNWSPSMTLRTNNKNSSDSESTIKKNKKKKTDKKSSFIQQPKNSNTFLAGLPSENDECSQSQHHILNLSPSIVDNMCSMLEQQLSVSTPMHTTTIRRRTGSLTSSNTSGSSSPASSTNGESIASPVQNNSRMYIKKRYLEQNEQFSERIR
jgi:headcase protein